MNQTIKKLLCLGVLIITGIVISCQKDKEVDPNITGEAVFSYSSNIAKSSELDNAASIIISLSNANGELVLSQEQLPLIKMGGSFITKPISLLVGGYELTEFIVTDAQGNALYIAPLSGSPKAYLVDIPLPIAFTISKDEVRKIVPEVLSTENSIPEDFGYSTFSFSVVETFDFLIAAMVYNPEVENFELTTATLSITSQNVSLYTAELEAITNGVTIRDGYASYVLRVTKNSYQTYIDTLSNEDLKLYYSSQDNGPLIVILYSAEDGKCEKNTVTDIDGNVYTTVRIGDQWWMAENLRVTAYSNGESITTGLSNSDWANAQFGAFAVYPFEGGETEGAFEGINSDEEMMLAYGVLYNWYAVVDSNGLCPAGWRVPSVQDWDELTDFLITNYPDITSENVGVELKSCRHVNSPIGEECATNIHPRWPEVSPYYSSDNFCFSAFPNGYRHVRGAYRGGATTGYWWSSTEINANSADNRYISSASGGFTESPYLLKNNGFSVRCVKN